MKVEYLPDGSPDCPLIRLFGGTKDDIQILQSKVLQLAKGKIRSISLQGLPGFDCLNLELKFVLSSENTGLENIFGDKFTCQLSAAKWQNISELLAPFLNNESNRHQWLDETSEISLLISSSSDGGW